MMTVIPGLLSSDELHVFRAALAAADWIDGNATSGPQSALAKNNLQLPETSPVARQLGEAVLDALGRNALFLAAALPHKVFPPLFNRYESGQEFRTHVDNSIRQLRGSDFRLRSDLSATLFLADPGDYAGGELVIEDLYGTHRVKGAAGDLVLYPASSLHHVTRVTQGARVACFFWIQSMVRDDGERTLLFQLDGQIQALAARLGQDDTQVVALTGTYHNLLRRWAEL
jgi:PKHD-type hydroxylase